ncbi:hypothetical protein SLU01_19160 [Sporosarcina luteola]|uniref:DUF3310 domain-containing protein n=1 Tax=Sporosarcina luteola TaxID=582850 RepID=A0A511Z859_9BACL|nr:DUF3310 domain-containing protein [Sporosarcina luteola]GEN83604.1 hypothetical protein SLU01_19160 [Sporosarcina luteola]
MTKPNFEYGPPMPKPIVTPKENAIRPSYYHTGNIDVIKYAEENFSKEERRGFYRMNVLKYISRFHKKNGVEDLNKADFYLRKLKELEESMCEGRE